MPDADETTRDEPLEVASVQEAPEMDAVDVGELDAPEVVFELDPVLAASIDTARAALAEITPDETIGELVATVAQGEHVVSLQFANLMSGYPGWLWTATLSRIDETEAVSVLEVELLPGEGAVLAPDWVPWTVRMADYQSAQDAAGDDLEADDESDDLDDVDVDLDDDSDSEELDVDSDDDDDSDDDVDSEDDDPLDAEESGSNDFGEDPTPAQAVRRRRRRR